MTAPIGLGVVGLGRAFTLLLPALREDHRFALVAAADPREEARTRFASEFGGRAFQNAAELAADPAVTAVYVATPHQSHAADAIAAASAGRHILVEKPMALDLEAASAMVAAARKSGVALIIGPSHSFDPPVRLARELIVSGRFGELRMLHLCTYTDFLYRPRRPEELVTALGGGAVFNQAPHQLEIARLLGGGMLTSLFAHCGAWDRGRPTEGAYSALLEFASGAFASLSYSGYGHYNTDAIWGGLGEDGRRNDPAGYGAARRRLAAAGPSGEAALRRAHAYGPGHASRPSPEAHPQFGLVIASLERADLLTTPRGVEIYGDVTREFCPAPAKPGVLDALFAAVVDGRAPTQTGEWGLATLEAALAILQSARERRAVRLSHQVPA